MELPLYESYFGFTEKDLPDDATVLKEVDKMIHDLEALRVAPVADPYTGPAILSGRASGVFFHEIFGHRVEGQRQKNCRGRADLQKENRRAGALQGFLGLFRSHRCAGSPTRTWTATTL